MPVNVGPLNAVAAAPPGSASPDKLKLTRRCFLVTCLAGCAALNRLPAPQRRPEVWALLADTHISAAAADVRGSCMADNLRRVVSDIQALAPDRALVNGDLAFVRGEPADYAAFGSLVEPMRRARMSLHLTLGNHDERDHALAALAPPHDSEIADKTVMSFVSGGLRWLLLDSLETVNAVRGSLGLQQRAWLIRQLDTADRAPTVVCLHHNPERALVGLRDTQEFLDIVLPRRQVKLVLFGHTHEYRLWSHEGLHFVNQPAVGYRFRPDASLGWLRAEFQEGAVQLQFRGVIAGERDHGTTCHLSWRADA